MIKSRRRKLWEERAQASAQMRILVISNFYPPHFIGGYEIGCRDIVEALRSRGHDVRVLTSRHGILRREQTGHVYRWLETDLALKIDSSAHPARIIKKELINRRALDRVCRAFLPEIVYVWNATHISISLALKAQQMGLAVCYFISDHWLNRWESDALYSLNQRRPRRLHKRLAWKPIVGLLHASGMLPRDDLDLSRVQFASRFLKQAALRVGRPVADAEVFTGGSMSGNSLSTKCPIIRSGFSTSVNSLRTKECTRLSRR